MTGLFDHLKIGGQTLKSKVELDKTLIELANATDYEFTGETSFTVPSFIKPKDFSLGVIVGGSGTGKSSLLKEFGEAKSFHWDASKAVASQVNPQVLMRLGLSSIPSLCRPFHVLSEGEKHRAEIARALTEGVKVIDEFTSYVHRDLAIAISIGTRKMIDREELKGVVLATCHEDVIQWLEPDWVFNTSTGDYVEGRLERPSITVEVFPCSSKAWAIFSQHHYLSSNLTPGARCWLASYRGSLVGFASSISFPGGHLSNAWREHRTVILPDFQGMGLGPKLSNYIAALHVESGAAYYSKTSHPAFGEYRNKSHLWRSVYAGRKDAPGYKDNHVNKYHSAEQLKKHMPRLCYSHEYIGDSQELTSFEAIEQSHTLPLFEWLDG